MLIDRPVVFGDASRMPFKDKVFDFVIASHILEHMAEPVVFLKEIQRVGKAGYIETPNALFERLHPYHIHCLEILERNGVLHIHKKKQAVEDAYLGTKEILADFAPWGKYMFESPQMFHVRYFWDNEIKYEIDNPEVSCEWIEEINAQSVVGDIKESYLTDERGWRAWGLAALNQWYSYRRNRRLKNFDITSIMACPSCGDELLAAQHLLSCQGCLAQYAYRDRIPDFTTNLAAGATTPQPR
jgi:hypothetical protein